MNKKDFPNWIFKNNNEQLFAFRNLRCINCFNVAVRVGWDGASIFGKNGLAPSLYYMNSIEFASLEDFKGSNGIGFKSFEVGAVRIDGSHWFSDCIYEPGLTNEDFKELKALLLAFYEDYRKAGESFATNVFYSLK